jgi:hypothetical protein
MASAVSFTGDGRLVFLAVELVEEEELNLDEKKILQALQGESVDSVKMEQYFIELSEFGGFAPDQYSELPEDPAEQEIIE